MNLKTRLQEVLAKHGELAAEREKAERAFREGWTQAREAIIATAFAETGNVIRGSGLPWLARPERENGSNALCVEVEPQGARSQYRLAFSPDYVTLRVKCLTSPPQLVPEESFSLESLDSATVGDKICSFVTAILSRPSRATAS